MRLWSLHPKYLDRQGLTAAWREALLAKAVLQGATRGYTRHPQLQRFQAHAKPDLAINAYLAALHDEAVSRGYNFDASKAGLRKGVDAIQVNDAQLAYEWQHLLNKLSLRSPAIFELWQDETTPQPHPLFKVVECPIAEWERTG